MTTTNDARGARGGAGMSELSDALGLPDVAQAEAHLRAAKTTAEQGMTAATMECLRLAIERLELARRKIDRAWEGLSRR